jgi:hypothetical protein
MMLRQRRRSFRIYSGKGALVKKYALGDLLTKQEIGDFTRSVSSIRWREGYYLIEEDSVLSITYIKNKTDDAKIKLRLRDGRVIK